MLSIAATGFYTDGGGDLWTASPTPTLTGTIVEANLAALTAYRGATPVATAIVSGIGWSLTVPAGTVPDAAAVELRVEARDRAGNLATATLRLRFDGAPPIASTPITTVRDETGDIVTYSVTPSFPVAFVPYDPIHNHAGAAVSLGAATACDASAPTVTKYGYLLDEAPPRYATEQTPPGRNPLRWQVALADDGVGVEPSTVAYRVRDVDAGAVALDWTALGEPYAVSLYRRATTAPSIAALGGSGRFAIDFRARDRLGREVSVTRCWNHRVLPAPILVGPVTAGGSMVQCAASGPTSCAATHGPAGSGKYALGLLTLADTTSPYDPIGVQVLSSGAPGTGLMEYPIWNPTSEPVYLTIDLTTPVGATYYHRYVDGRWAGVSGGSAACGDDESGIDTSNPQCVRIARPTEPVPAEQGTSAPAQASVQYGVRIWEEVSPSSVVELAACAGCSQTGTVGPRVTVLLPPRAAPNLFGDPAPPRKFWIVPVVKGIPDLRPGGSSPYYEFSVAGVSLTGQLLEARQGCGAAISYSAITHRYTCPQIVTYYRYRALSSASGVTASFAIANPITTRFGTSLDGVTPMKPSHVGDEKRERPNFTWQTTESPLPPTP